MFSAYDENNSIVQIEDAIEGQKYYCPICNAEVIVKAKESTAVHMHFAHKKGSQCYDDWTHDMSEWHRQWQNCFPERFREVVMEKDGKKHRADIFTETTVIEFQHSPIKAEEIRARNDFYNGLGHPVVWIFDMTGRISSIGEDINPLHCTFENELFIKRKMAQFDNINKQGVEYYFQYEIPNEKVEGETEEILLLLKRIDSKNIRFYIPAITNIKRKNFIKEYLPDSDLSDDVLSIRELKKRSENEKANKRMLEEAKRRAQTVNRYNMSQISRCLPRRRITRIRF